MPQKLSKKAKANKERYSNEYNKKTYRIITFKVKRTEEDVINKLDAVPSKASYLIDLVKEDIKKEG